MTDKLPAPCEHCGATGLFQGSECVECRAKGYRLIVEGRVTVAQPTEPAHRPWRKGSRRVVRVS